MKFEGNVSNRRGSREGPKADWKSPVNIRRLAGRYRFRWLGMMMETGEQGVEKVR